MQLVRITSNNPDYFIPIRFNVGEDARNLNVVYGDVRRPQDKSRDSHNLGKTTLITVIDFLFLSNVDKGHLFTRHRESFEDLEFFLELYVNSSEYIGIRRGTADPNSVALTRSDKPLGNLVLASDLDWQHPELSLTGAQQMLDGWLGIEALGPYAFRKAITYFLRSQRDWDDELQLQKFSLGADRDWKPFVGLLFGFDQELLQRKYQLDSEVDRLKDESDRLELRTAYAESDLGMLQAEYNLLHDSVDTLEQQLDGFEFDEAEQQMITELVEETETEISSLNEKVYNARYDITQIERALSQKDRFDVEKAKSIFEEANVAFPEALKRDYDQLLEFRKKITSERNRELRKRLKRLQSDVEEYRARIGQLDDLRRQRMTVVESHDTIEKFKVLQRQLSQRLVELNTKADEIESLLSLANSKKLLREAKRERDALIDKIRVMIENSTAFVKSFQREFNAYCKRVLGKEGIFSFGVNEAGNLTYDIGLGLAERGGQKSSQGDGTSYKKLVCALFDLALLKCHSGSQFFEFVYHDGVLEGLDDRRKIQYLDLVRDEVSRGTLQYILTAISDDRPHDDDGEVIEFPDNEIVLRLHDGGAEGRLFRGPAF